MKKVKVNEIYETSDYDMFKLSKSNRNVAYRKELFEEAKKGFIAPIVVDKNMIVIDGQSRLFHARKAEVPIKFFVDENISEKDIVRRILLKNLGQTKIILKVMQMKVMKIIKNYLN